MMAKTICFLAPLNPPAVQECSTMTDFPKNAIGNFQRLSGYDERRFSLRGTDNDPVSHIGGKVHAD